MPSPFAKSARKPTHLSTPGTHCDVSGSLMATRMYNSRNCDRLVFLHSWLQETVIVERWWKVPLSKVGRQPRIKHRRFKVFRLVEDTKHSQKQPMELILTDSVEGLGARGDVVLVDKSYGRNRLLANNLAVYPSPENKKMFEEEMKLLQDGTVGKSQTLSGIKTVRFLQSCHLEVGMKNNKEWELTPAIVARHFLKNLRVAMPPYAVKLPDEPITQFGEYWCEVTVNGLDTVRVPMSVVNFMLPKTRRYKHWLAKQEALQASPTTP
ncbi:PREDICTED: 39S ribosomal protein L9, mitochondrial [Gekko japonicus]|uniref:Large ribosomal subunit protein bL9m n=1 Tax=Gekko japonicus TaxID=146911 RepID=A0ABM1KCS7_GEKJA|nr:PREDICTED: 39S ribosomal protein L9, mitochondrial [Gekko japonicus]